MATPPAPQPLDALEETIRERAAALAADADSGATSYTAKLLRAGAGKIGEKVMEEAGELVEAATEEGDAGREHFVAEAGDLIYHMLVLCRWRGVDFADVQAELARRFGVSGIEEKASRDRG